MSRTRGSDGQFTKRVRVPFGGHRTKLQLSDVDRKLFDERGMVPRWFNDLDGRVQRAQSGGYDFVDPKHAASIGIFSINDDKDLSGKVSKVVSKGGGEPVMSYLMEISKENYDEDQAAKEAINQRVDDALNAGKPGGNTVENQYVPQGHINQV